ncbi:hypothetical protein [Alteromonas gracilis]|uniref:hypothetical protein n=1 Tax=Alteromonas gracilis TaxID=1479524 RepID=UPI003734FEE5
MLKKSVFSIGALMIAMPLLSNAQQFSAEDIELRASNLEMKRVEVVKRLSESIAQLEVRDVSVIRAETSSVNESDLGLEELHGQFRIKLQEGVSEPDPKQ